MGGNDSAQPRYIHTKLPDLTYKIYNKEDGHVLKYLDDDGFPVEPETYVPIIPMILVNGGEGIELDGALMCRVIIQKILLQI